MKVSAIFSYLVQPILFLLTGLIEMSNIDSTVVMATGIILGAVIDIILAIHSAKRYKTSCIISIIWNVFLLFINFSYGVLFFGMLGV